MFGSRSQSLRLFFVPAVLVIGATLVALSCGGGDPSASGGDPADDDGGPVTFEVSMNDDGVAGNNRFEANEFTVSAGQQITFNLTNDGTLPHNMRVDGGDGEYNTGDDTLSQPDIILIEESGTLVWTAPEEPGTIIFQCDLHPTDMTGSITVK